MANRSREQLKYDRRLLYRPGWLTDEERQKFLDALPDVSHKAGTVAPAPEPAGSARAPGGAAPQADSEPAPGEQGS